MDWTAIAAFTAAALSLGNVVISGRLVRRGRLEQWRQEEERPIVTRMVIISGDALEEWQTSGYARHRWVASLDRDPDRKTEDTKARDESVEHWRTGSELYDNLRFESGQLDLMAGPGLRDVAARLVREHESIRHWIRPASGADDWLDLLITHGNTVIQLHKDLVNQARAELGVDQLDMKRRLRALLPPSRKAPGPPMF